MKSRSGSLPFILASCALCLSTASQAAIFSTQLAGSNESPANTSPATGSATVNFDLATHLLSIETSFSGLTGNTVAAHIHCCVAPPGNTIVATQVPTFSGFPSGATSGTYSNTFNTLDLTSWNQAFVTANGGTAAGAEAALAAGLAAGTSYLNIHTTTFAAGEIRGFLTAAPTGRVPEPSALALFAITMAAIAVARRRRSPSKPS